MDWMAALRARLLADAPLDALVDDRIYWGEAPQAVPLPRLVLLMIDDGRVQHLKGFQGLQPSRVQFDAYGRTAREAWDVTNAAIGASVPGTTSDGHKFSRAMIEIGPRDLPERVTAGDGTSKTIFRVSMDLIFHHAETEEVS